MNMDGESISMTNEVALEILALNPRWELIPVIYTQSYGFRLNNCNAFPTSDEMAEIFSVLHSYEKIMETKHFKLEWNVVYNTLSFIPEYYIFGVRKEK